MSDDHPTHEIDALSLDLPDVTATLALGRRLAACARAGDIIALTGDLGAGKTELARAFVNALPRPDGTPGTEHVPSPTFTLVQVYERQPAPVWHFDLYRLATPDEVVELGWDEARAEGIVLVEWPDRLGPLAPADRLDVTLFHPPEGPGRRAVLQAGDAWRARLPALGEETA